jgi:hypothetical protein
MLSFHDWWCQIICLYLLTGLRRLRGELRGKRFKKCKKRIKKRFRKFFKRTWRALKPVRWVLVAILLFALTMQLDSDRLKILVALLGSRVVSRLRSGKLNFDEFMDDLTVDVIATLLLSICLT